MIFGVPDNFEDKLPILKDKTFKWENVCHSGTKINSSSMISCYQNNAETSVGNLVLVPALATNSKMDPLMKTIQYWGLTHRYNVFNIDTFLGDFQNEITKEKIKNNTYPELKTVLKQSINFIQPYTMNKPICVVGHCVSSTAITDILNDCVKRGEKLPVQLAMFFAPFPKIPAERYETFMVRRMQIESENQKNGKISPTELIKLQHLKFVCAMRDFIRTVEDIKFEPSVVAKWGIPVSFITAGRDKISPAPRTKENLDILTGTNGTTQTHYLHVPNNKHNFAQLNEDSFDVIKLIINLMRSTKTK